MRIAFLAHPESPNGWYRAIGPAAALADRGHEAVRLMPSPNVIDGDLLAGADVLLVHRFADAVALRLALIAARAGAAVVWDNDDDVVAIPRGDPAHRHVAGARGGSVQAAIRKMLRIAHLVTTPSALLAEHYRKLGAPHVEVIENHVQDESLQCGAKPRRGRGVTIGWTAGTEHRADVERLPIAAALRRVLDAHGDVRVETVGASLGIDDPRYAHRERVLFMELPATAAAYDIGIAPIADIPFNRARSNVKLKEYAAVGVPWLASPIGPYAGMGEEQGGRLVSDDRWFEALDQLVREGRTRRRLAKRALRWGRGQTIGANAGVWETALSAAVERAVGDGRAAAAPRSSSAARRARAR